MDTATVAYEALINSPVMPDEDKKENFHNALLLSGNAQHWQLVKDDAQQLEALNAMDDKTYAVLAQAYYFTKDMAKRAGRSAEVDRCGQGGGRNRPIRPRCRS